MGTVHSAFTSIMASIEPEERAYEMEHMLESVDPRERARLHGMAATAPAS
jgi:hypothetical protein